ncbi:MAG: hypothetical protein MUO18_04760 [Methanomassiliicoccales archaeon]|nr:hypothetical protein [Methanomassiliicoccales archaeon]
MPKTSDIGPEEMLVGVPRVRLRAVVSALEKIVTGPIPRSRTKQCHVEEAFIADQVADDNDLYLSGQ